MATNVDFDNLITRIDVATNQLEVAVVAVDQGTEDIQDAVIEAQQAAQQAGVSASTASTQASNAATSATTTQGLISQAEGLVDTLLATAPFQEAPTTGLTYGRNNEDWVVVDTGGGGVGTVVSVNDITPDVEGNITLTPVDVGALPDTYTPDWIDVSGKPTFSTVATSGSYTDLSDTPTIPTVPVQEAPTDGVQYARQDSEWTPIASGGGGGSDFTWDSFEINNLQYKGDYWPETGYPEPNPFTRLNLEDISVFAGGRNKTMKELIIDQKGPLYSKVDTDGLGYLPSGRYILAIGGALNAFPPFDQGGNLYIDVHRIMHASNGNPSVAQITAFWEQHARNYSYRQIGTTGRWAFKREDLTTDFETPAT